MIIYSFNPQKKMSDIFYSTKIKDEKSLVAIFPSFPLETRINKYKFRYWKTYII